MSPAPEYSIRRIVSRLDASLDDALALDRSPLPAKGDEATSDKRVAWIGVFLSVWRARGLNACPRHGFLERQSPRSNASEPRLRNDINRRGGSWDR